LGTSMLIGLFAPNIFNMIRHKNKSIRWLMVTLAATSATLFLASLTHYRTHAYIQLIFDRMNHQMLEVVKENVSKNGYVFANMETRKEYVEMIETFLVDFYGLTEINYTHVSVETLERLQWFSDGIVLMPNISNKPRLIVRAGIDEEYTMLWNEIVLWNMDDRLIPFESLQDEFRIININIPVVFCPIIGRRGYCENPDPFFDFRKFSYGWDIYRIR